VPKAPTGGVVEKTTTRGTSFALRFRAHGRREFLHLGYAAEGWTRQRAEQELQNVLADVRRGMWRPPPDPSDTQPPRDMPTFHEFASDWFQAQKLEGGRNGRGLTAAGAADLQWRLCSHLLPTFAAQRLDEITIEDVDRYRQAKVREAERRRHAIAAGRPPRDRDGRLLWPLSTTSINKTLSTLAAILEVAVEYELVPRNVAKGRRRRLPATTPRRSYIDRADHIAALLDAAGRLDGAAITGRGQRRALLATLVFAGLRISEALALCWRDIDLARGEILIRRSKTDAGIRKVRILPALRDELVALKARPGTPAPAELAFPTSTGSRQSVSNVRSRVLLRAIADANTALATAGLEPLPDGLTPHSLRRTYASLLFAVGEPPPWVMRQMGHTTPNLTLAIYAREMDRRDGEPQRLKALVEGADWAPMGTSPAGAVRADELSAQPMSAPTAL
jgi:integrase